MVITYLYGKRYQKNSCKKRRILLLLSVKVSGGGNPEEARSEEPGAGRLYGFFSG
jgi:hypothetical protein